MAEMNKRNGREMLQYWIHRNILLHAFENVLSTHLYYGHSSTFTSMENTSGVLLLQSP